MEKRIIPKYHVNTFISIDMVKKRVQSNSSNNLFVMMRDDVLRLRWIKSYLRTVVTFQESMRRASFVVMI